MERNDVQFKILEHLRSINATNKHRDVKAFLLTLKLTGRGLFKPMKDLVERGYVTISPSERLDQLTSARGLDAVSTFPMRILMEGSDKVLQVIERDEGAKAKAEELHIARQSLEVSKRSERTARLGLALSIIAVIISAIAVFWTIYHDRAKDDWEQGPSLNTHY